MTGTTTGTPVGSTTPRPTTPLLKPPLRKPPLRKTHRLVRTAEIMGTVVSVHVILDRGEEDRDSPDSPVPGGTLSESPLPDNTAADGTAPDDAVAAIERSFDELHGMDRIFSTYRADSDISRIRAGSLAEADADPLVALVRRACERAEAVTGGLFSAHWRGGFDPTGYVKGWAVERAFNRWLRPLLGLDGVIAVGMNAGGDMQLATRPDADWRWRVGIADPSRPGMLLATTELTDGAVATSGTAERGAHIRDPRSAKPPTTGAASATVIADRLSDADVWATAAIVAGINDLGWVARARHTSGLVVGYDGRIRRWAAGDEVGSLG